MVVSFSSLKGGCGKTTNAILTATCMAGRGKKVLFIDLDTNNSGTIFFTAGLENVTELISQKNVFEAISHNTIQPYVIPTNRANIDIIASHLNIFKIRSMPYKELKRTLADANNYDCVILDTPPTWDNIVINALIASDYIITPVFLDTFNEATTEFLEGRIFDELYEYLYDDDGLSKWYLLITRWEHQYEGKTSSDQSRFYNLFKNHHWQILSTKISRANAASNYTKESGYKLSVNASAPGVKRLANDYNKLCDALLQEDGLTKTF